MGRNGQRNANTQRVNIMKTSLEIVSDALRQMINGEPAPSIKSPEFADFMTAASAIATPGADGAYQQSLYASVGANALQLVLLRLNASVNAEREIALMRDKSRPMC